MKTEGVLSGTARRLLMFVVALGIGIAAFFLLRSDDADEPGTGTQTARTSTALLTSSGFLPALTAVEERSKGKPLLKVQVTEQRAEFHLKQAEGATGFAYDSGGDVQPIQVQVVGSGSLAGHEFPFSKLDPVAIDRMAVEARRLSDASDFRITVLTFERSPVDNALTWTIVGETKARTGLVYQANPDGSNVRAPGGRR
jgi:hypothetical protein